MSLVVSIWEWGYTAGVLILTGVLVWVAMRVAAGRTEGLASRATSLVFAVSFLVTPTVWAELVHLVADVIDAALWGS